jgi:hypothetical protein
VNLEDRYEWEVYYNGVLLGRTNTEGRHQLIKEKVSEPIGINSIEFKLVLKMIEYKVICDRTNNP